MKSQRDLEPVEHKAQLLKWDSHSPELKHRIQTVAQELLSGARPSQIIQKWSDEWGVVPATIQNMYIQEAKELIRREFPYDTEDLKEELLAKYRHLYHQNMELKDLKEARAVLDSVVKLTAGINTQINVLGNIQTINLVEVRNGDTEDTGD